MKITFISDTHGQHRKFRLPGGDLLIHSGDFMTSGKIQSELANFCEWFKEQEYSHKILIAGNHDVLLEKPRTGFLAQALRGITYLQDSSVEVQGLQIYGSPWQPKFKDWAFNLPRCSDELREKWRQIPDNVDILVTHGPPQGHLDYSGPPYNEPLLGCELLRFRVDQIRPKIHVFGHIHGSHGYKFHEGTHFINASVLNEQYSPVNNPVNAIWELQTNEILFPVYSKTF